jgi:hypothetical protein
VTREHGPGADDPIEFIEPDTSAFTHGAPRLNAQDLGRSRTSKRLVLTGAVALFVIAVGIATRWPKSSRQTSPTTSVAATTAQSTTSSIPDEHTIECLRGLRDGPPPSDSVVLDVASLDVGAPVLLEAASAPDYPISATAYLHLRTGTSFDIDIAPESNAVVLMSWSHLPLSTHIHIPACVPYGAQTPWISFGGNFQLRQNACVGVTFTVGDRRQTVRLGIGAPCLGSTTPERSPTT